MGPDTDINGLTDGRALLLAFLQDSTVLAPGVAKWLIENTSDRSAAALRRAEAAAALEATQLRPGTPVGRALKGRFSTTKPAKAKIVVAVLEADAEALLEASNQETGLTPNWRGESDGRPEPDAPSWSGLEELIKSFRVEDASNTGELLSWREVFRYRVRLAVEEGYKKRVGVRLSKRKDEKKRQRELAALREIVPRYQSEYWSGAFVDSLYRNMVLSSRLLPLVERLDASDSLTIQRRSTAILSHIDRRARQAVVAASTMLGYLLIRDGVSETAWWRQFVDWIR